MRATTASPRFAASGSSASFKLFAFHHHPASQGQGAEKEQNAVQQHSIESDPGKHGEKDISGQSPFEAAAERGGVEFQESYLGML